MMAPMTPPDLARLAALLEKYHGHHGPDPHACEACRAAQDIANRLAALLAAYRALEAERDEWRLEARCSEGVISMVIDSIGGEVEGRPTTRINFLQRVRELVRNEATPDAATVAAAQCGCHWPANHRAARATP